MDPIARFEELYAEARKRETADATAMALATADAAGRPSVRMVLLKAVDPRGFVFYTNLGSRKARELAANPEAALCFHWPTLGWQVRATGPVEEVTAAEADSYFASRPRGSQVGAWASRQSQPLKDREDLLAAVRAVEGEYSGKDVPRPPFWSGFRLLPREIEFWQSEASRLHRRTVHRRGAEGRWTAELLQP